MLIKDLMSPPTNVVSPDTPLATVVTLMNSRDWSSVLVLNQEILVGILTERDFLQQMAVLLKQSNIAEFGKQHISNIMTKNPIVVSENTLLHEALVIAKSHKIRHLPVIDLNEKLVGIVSQNQIMRAYSNLINQLSALENTNAELQSLALEDALMQIGNRRAMEIDLQYSQQLAFRQDDYLAIALFDIDYFKKFNDLYGHPAGDEALQKIANMMQTTIRASDRVYRYGGEEILVLMPNTDKTNALDVANRIRFAVESLKIKHEKSDFNVVTMSGGVACGKQTTWQNLIKMADKSLYKAKNSGRNNVKLADA